MELKDWIEIAIKESPIKGLAIAPKLLELEALADYFQLMYGVELQIFVHPTERSEGRFYGRGIIDDIKS